jgi:hypothetical protein
MTHLQELENRIPSLKLRLVRLHDHKEKCEKAWHPSVKAMVPSLDATFEKVLQELREVESEIHRITWAP